MRRIDTALMPLYHLLPTTYMGIFYRAFNSGLPPDRKITVLDIGCGDGYSISSLHLPGNFSVTGVDIFDKYLRMAKSTGAYSKVVRGEALAYLSSHRQKYDVVIASHILEHMTKADGYRFIKLLEKAASRRVIISCPIGYISQDDDYDHNSHQKHRAGWTVAEMHDLGYRVRSQGMKFLWHDSNLVLKYGLASYGLFLISNLLQPVLWLYPQLGTYMVTTKELV